MRVLAHAHVSFLLACQSCWMNECQTLYLLFAFCLRWATGSCRDKWISFRIPPPILAVHHVATQLVVLLCLNRVCMREYLVEHPVKSRSNRRCGRSMRRRNRQRKFELACRSVAGLVPTRPQQPTAQLTWFCHGVALGRRSRAARSASQLELAGRSLADRSVSNHDGLRCESISKGNCLRTRPPHVLSTKLSHPL
jgi:hypothetical protein